MPNHKSKKIREIWAKKMASGLINLPNGEWVPANSNKHGTMAKNSVSGAAHKRVEC